MNKKAKKVNAKHDTLLIKNYSGSFNDDGIGHEVINSFDANNNKNDWRIFYVPPYGSIKKETIDFIDEPIYKNIKKILIFDSTSITNILKLKAVVLDPIPITDKKEFDNVARSFKYGKYNTPLNKIDFDNEKFDEEKEDDTKPKIFPFTYKVKKVKYYNLEKYNLFIWHERNKKTAVLLKKSLSKFKIVYKGYKDPIVLKKTKLGEKNYSYNLGNDIEKWFIDEVKPLLISNNLYPLDKVPSKLKLSIKYDKDNILENIKRLNDENLYTNFICYILNSSTKLKEKFFEFLVTKFFKVNGYKSDNVLIKPQYQALTPMKKCFNKYLDATKNKSINNIKKYKEKLTNTYKLSSKEINKTTKKFTSGLIDIYLQDDNYIMAIENKIKSEINGKNSNINKDIDQLKTYKTFLKDQIDYKIVKASYNKVILLAPERVMNNFINYDAEVPVMSYRDLASFFKENSKLIDKRYRTDFLNAIYKHSLSKEEDAVTKFYYSLQVKR